MRSRYQRRLSREEAEKGYVLVEKAALSFFPPQGTVFPMRDAQSDRLAAIESYACTCRGPERPHEHYFIRWPALTAGAMVTIERTSDSEGSYQLRVS